MLNLDTALDRDVWEKRRGIMVRKYYDSLSVKDMEIVMSALGMLASHNFVIRNTLCDSGGKYYGFKCYAVNFDDTMTSDIVLKTTLFEQRIACIQAMTDDEIYCRRLAAGFVGATVRPSK